MTFCWMGLINCPKSACTFYVVAIRTANIHFDWDIVFCDQDLHFKANILEI